jgi:hypothetical protein
MQNQPSEPNKPRRGPGRPRKVEFNIEGAYYEVIPSMVDNYKYDACRTKAMEKIGREPGRAYEEWSEPQNVPNNSDNLHKSNNPTNE